MINIYKQPKSANTYANLFIQEIPDKVKNVCLLFIGHLETIYNILVAKPGVNFTVIDGGDTTEALPYIYNGANLKESIKFEDGWCEDSDTLVSNLQTILNNRIGVSANQMFDLVLMNPPYGKNSSLVTKIAKSLLESDIAENYILLAPLDPFKKNKIINVHLRNLSFVNNVFADADISTLCIGNLVKQQQSVFDVELERIKAAGSRKYMLYTAVKNYNATHPQNLNLQASVNRPSNYEKYLTWVDRLFYFVPWTPASGVHDKTGDTTDVKLNFRRFIPPKSAREDAGYGGILFENTSSFEHFRDFWYRGTISNEILSIIRIFSKDTSTKNLMSYFPNLDWSKSQTDQEILKEIGLPEDFLEKE